ncbi:hypothetical protein BAE44_0024396 [Dichanthelium oligosanthes]|uniref:No apical meristem-associated C-terminal domain-containing protein n=1 Tax=Dichanthelium oligosanthes TaxID=888268 RepID=A0A1E5UP44_9POAL|nr:hypothetical protein BAE44_0024396 [Dichanthelium oligosanthes]
MEPTTGGAYWKRIYEYYNSHKDFLSTRFSESLSKRWAIIQAAVARFCSFFAEQGRLNESGKTEENRLNDATAEYEVIIRTKFKFLHCWYILRGERKWQDTLPALLKGRKGKGKASALASAAPTKTVGASEGRPICRDRAKKLRSGEGGDSSSSACLEVLQRLTVSREADTEARDVKLDTCCKWRLKRAYSIDAVREDEIMSMDLEGLPERKRRYWEARQNEIMDRRLDGHADPMQSNSLAFFCSHRIHAVRRDPTGELGSRTDGPNWSPSRRVRELALALLHGVHRGVPRPVRHLLEPLLRHTRPGTAVDAAPGASAAISTNSAAHRRTQAFTAVTAPPPPPSA